MSEVTLTCSHTMGLERGDFITVSGFANIANNGSFIVRRVRGFGLIVQPASFWDYVRHYARRVMTWAKWHYYGISDFANELRDSWMDE